MKRQYFSNVKQMFSHIVLNYEMVKELIRCVLYVFLVVLSNCEKEKRSKTKKKGYNIQ